MSTTTSPDPRPAQALTFEQVQERLQVGRTTLYRMVQRGELPSVKIGKCRRWLAEDVDTYLRGLRDQS